jgi:hypothetical protein
MLNQTSGIEAGQVCVEVVSILPCQSAMLRYVRSSQDLVHFAGSARQRMHAHQMWGLVLQVTTRKSDDPLNGCSKALPLSFAFVLDPRANWRQQ